MSYFEIIKTAIIMFPLFAMLITAPYMLYQYHKYGSIHPYKTLVIFSFALYLLIIYYLVILPLPDKSVVANLTTPRANLKPFSFIIDFIKNSGIVLTNYHTYLSAIKKPCFYVPIYNILICIPFGIYLHYYFKCNLKKTILFSFALSLFFELTQLSGLYFIYPRGYRLFDIDDLLLNTFGGLLGYYIAYAFISILPSKDKIECEARKLGKKVSLVKRLTAFALDFIIYSIILTIIYLFFNKSLVIVVAVIYYIILPCFMNYQTLGKRFLNLKFVSLSNKKMTPFKLFIREVLFLLENFIIPFLFVYGIFLLINNIGAGVKINIIILGIGCIIIFIYYLTILIKLIGKKMLLYEIISHTKISSTITDDISKEKN